MRFIIHVYIFIVVLRWTKIYHVKWDVKHAYFAWFSHDRTSIFFFEIFPSKANSIASLQWEYSFYTKKRILKQFSISFCILMKMSHTWRYNCRTENKFNVQILFRICSTCLIRFSVVSLLIVRVCSAEKARHICVSHLFSFSNAKPSEPTRSATQHGTEIKSRVKMKLLFIFCLRFVFAFDVFCIQILLAVIVASDFSPRITIAARVAFTD